MGQCQDRKRAVSSKSCNQPEAARQELRKLKPLMYSWLSLRIDSHAAFCRNRHPARSLPR